MNNVQPTLILMVDDEALLRFKTTIYGHSDRTRGIEETRDVLLINPDDMKPAGLHEGQVTAC